MLDQIQQWQIEQLATNGGFSDAFIAAYVFNRKNPSESQVRAVTTYRLKVRALLGDWRNGRTTLAKRHAEQAVSRRRAAKTA